jgi:hypothetical protein
MTPEEWDRCNSPKKMLKFLRAGGRASERKLLLASAAFCRCAWQLLDPGHQQIVAAAEAAADGAGLDWKEPHQHQLEYSRLRENWSPAVALADGDPARAAERAADLLGVASWTDADYSRASARAEAEVGWEALAREAAALERVDLSEAVAAWGEARVAVSRVVERIRTKAMNQASRRALRELTWPLRCIFGNPFGPPPALVGEILAYQGGAARRLAESIYAGRRFADLPVLADLLEEAGLTDAALLGHLRGPGPHVLGCHALDAVLGKS